MDAPYVYFTFEESTINVIPSSNIFMQVARKYRLTYLPKKFNLFFFLGTGVGNAMLFTVNKTQAQM